MDWNPVQASGFGRKSLKIEYRIDPLRIAEASLSTRYAKALTTLARLESSTEQTSTSCSCKVGGFAYVFGHFRIHEDTVTAVE